MHIRFGLYAVCCSPLGSLVQAVSPPLVALTRHVCRRSFWNRGKLATIRMTKRVIRISWTAICSTACLAVCLLWIRSYQSSDIVYVFTKYALVVTSERGTLLLGVNENPQPQFGCKVQTYPWRGQPFLIQQQAPFAFVGHTYGRYVVWPHWFAAQMFAVLAFVPWVSWKKFTVKRLLVLTTYLAVLCTLIFLSRR